MEAYRKIEKCEESLQSNEIRVRRGVGIWIYFKRAYDILNDPEGLNESIVIKGWGSAM